MFFTTDTLAAHPRCGISCRLDTGCNHPCMEPYGRYKIPLLVVGEAPGKKEDVSGRPFVGSSGELLRAAMKIAGVNLDDCLVTNAVCCRPPGNRTPKPDEITACRVRLDAVIEKHRPRAILALGATALASLLTHRMKWGAPSLAAWRGWPIVDVERGCRVVVTFHPSFLLRTGEEASHITAFQRDIALAIKEARRAKRPAGNSPSASILSDAQAVAFMDDVLIHPPELLGVDFETTGLKPHAKGHEIICCALAKARDVGVSFMVKGAHPGVKQALINVLESKHVLKCAHNMKFEDTWARVRLGARPRGWAWDSMIAAHIIDNRFGVTGLKFQSAVHLSVFDYSSAISRYLEPMEKDSAMFGGNAFNQIHRCDKTALMTYNAMDAVLELRLSLIQRKRMGV